jgi:hypothetical protein
MSPSAATYGAARTESGYAQSNLWGAHSPQCISVSGDGLTPKQPAANKVDGVRCSA